MADTLKKPVLVVGGGIGGIQAAHDLAEMNIPVYLVEKSSSIGGRMAQLDKTFPTNDCSACILAPKVTDTYNHPLVYTLTLSDLVELKGEAPNLTAVIRKRPRFVDEEKCTGCGACTEVCPVTRNNEFDMNLSTRKAIYKPFAQAVPNKVTIDPLACVKCRKCEKTCQTGAINYDMKEEIIELSVSGVVLCPGYQVTNRIPAPLGYHKYDEVVTALEFERILSASGPFGGHVQRPGDGRVPKRIAFLQCVGSRDHSCQADYCSAVCCMYAVKEAQITKEHLPEVEDIDIYYMDMRAHGKDFERYVENGRNKYGLNFKRGKVASITKNEAGDMVVDASNEKGQHISQAYDMVVLSTGFMANADTSALCKTIGVATDPHGFISCDPFMAPATSRKGVFACGAAAGPKDIPDTVTEASAAAAAAAEIAAETEITEKDRNQYFPPEEKIPSRDVSNEPIRMGVFVCHCGVNIAGYVDVKAVCEEIKKIPQVTHVEDVLYACSVDAQNAMIETIKNLGLNRIVVASCTPRTHEPLFQSVLQKTGLNPYLFSMANIRDQCSWVHMDDKEAATQKAIHLVRMAVGKGLSAKQLSQESIPVDGSALVIGGGVAGMSAALAIAGCGHQVYLVERAGRLGGNARKLNELYNGRPMGLHVDYMIQKVVEHPLISIYSDTVIETIDGYVGNFHTDIISGGQKTTLEHGVVIVATGANEGRPTEYLYGSNPKVLTQLELEEQIKNKDERLNGANNIVMIQCVGSREGDHMYCSKVCCSQALRNAKALKKKNPDAQITILTREVRSYGMYENDYRSARREGINFIRYDLDQKPVVSEDGDLNVEVYDVAAGEKVSLQADLVVLAAPIKPNVEANKELAQMLKVPMNQDGFFLEAHAKLRPVDFATEGVFVCGLAHSPRNVKESVIQGRAAAGKAATVLAKTSLQAAGTIAAVNTAMCTGCATCEQVCAYGAITVQEVSMRGKTAKKAVVNNVLCKGCGTCAANCRCGAIDVGGFSDRQIVNEIEYLLRLPKEMRV
jgi:heterodisulfide reductase subunit A